MWSKKTAAKLRSELERLYETISDCYAAGNIKRYTEHAIDIRRVEKALARLTIGRVR